VPPILPANTKLMPACTEFELAVSSPTCPANIRGATAQAGCVSDAPPTGASDLQSVAGQSLRICCKAQFEEFARVFGELPERIDGHHHLHLSANVLLKGLLRRDPGEKKFFFSPRRKKLAESALSQGHRQQIGKPPSDCGLSVSAIPLEPHGRLARIRTLAQTKAVEIETHPVNSDEYEFLTGDGVVQWANEVPIARSFLCHSTESNSRMRWRTDGKLKTMTKDQSQDTGMAMVLLALLIFLRTRRNGWLYAAMIFHVVNMVVPRIYALWRWFGWVFRGYLARSCRKSCFRFYFLAWSHRSGLFAASWERLTETAGLQG